MQPNLLEAERRIEEARRTQAGSLDLGDLALSELPASLRDLPHLRALHLGRFRPTGAGDLEWDKGRAPSELTDLSPLAGLEGLQKLDLAACTGVTGEGAVPGASLGARGSGARRGSGGAGERCQAPR